MGKDVNQMYKQTITELTLIKRVKLPAKRFKHILNPIFKNEEYKQPIGKFCIADLLEAEKQKFNLAPEKLENNIRFLAWIANRLIKSKDPYWDKTESELINMMTIDTFLELNELLTGAVPDELKKKSVLIN